MAKRPAVVIGIGEMGSVFARGLLRLGYPVYPVQRDSDMKKLARGLPRPRLVVVAVAEGDLATVLHDIPKKWRDRLALLQNELLPADYAGLPDVTVISAWFEKKPGREAKVIIPSPAYGPRAALLARALATLEIPVTEVETPRQMLFELVLKNLYILVSNIAGLRTGGTVAELWDGHQALARAVAKDVIALQEGLTGSRFNNDELIAAMVGAFEGDPAHQCMGRSARARLERALAHADRLEVGVPTLREIADDGALRATA
jgi:hypothetical protein